MSEFKLTNKIEQMILLHYIQIQRSRLIVDILHLEKQNKADFDVINSNALRALDTDLAILDKIISELLISVNIS